MSDELVHAAYILIGLAAIILTAIITTRRATQYLWEAHSHKPWDGIFWLITDDEILRYNIANTGWVELPAHLKGTLKGVFLPNLTPGSLPVFLISWTKYPKPIGVPFFALVERTKETFGERGIHLRLATPISLVDTGLISIDIWDQNEFKGFWFFPAKQEVATMT
jgi:hypothetical protein